MRLRQFVAGLEFDEHQENIHLVDCCSGNHHWQKVFKLEKMILGGAPKIKVSTIGYCQSESFNQCDDLIGRGIK